MLFKKNLEKSKYKIYKYKNDGSALVYYIGNFRACWWLWPKLFYFHLNAMIPFMKRYSKFNIYLLCLAERKYRCVVFVTLVNNFCWKKIIFIHSFGKTWKHPSRCSVIQFLYYFINFILNHLSLFGLVNHL